MQRAAASAVEPGGAAENLGERARRVRAAADDVAMVAMGGADQVVGVEGFEHGAAGRLLPDIDVIVAREAALLVEADHGLLEMAHQQHALEDRQAGPAVELFGHSCPRDDSFCRLRAAAQGGRSLAESEVSWRTYAFDRRRRVASWSTVSVFGSITTL